MLNDVYWTRIDYGLNYHYLAYGFTTTWFGTGLGPAKINVYSNPSSIIYAGECWNSAVATAYTFLMLHTYNMTSSGEYGCPWPAHAGRANFVFLDGHVETKNSGSADATGSQRLCQMLSENNYYTYWGRRKNQ